MTGRFIRAHLTPTGLRIDRRTYPCTIGRNGLTSDKREGDNATPRGTLQVEETWYRPDRITQPAPWARPIGPRDLWCDAPEHSAYNHHVRTPFAASHEAMRRADPLYDIVLVLNWNYPKAIPGRGSAIFLHQQRRPGYPTAGCLALRRRDLHALVRQLKPGTTIRIP